MLSNCDFSIFQNICDQTALVYTCVYSSEFVPDVFLTNNQTTNLLILDRRTSVSQDCWGGGVRKRVCVCRLFYLTQIVFVCVSLSRVVLCCVCQQRFSTGLYSIREILTSEESEAFTSLYCIITEEMRFISRCFITVSEETLYIPQRFLSHGSSCRRWEWIPPASASAVWRWSRTASSASERKWVSRTRWSSSTWATPPTPSAGQSQRTAPSWTRPAKSSLWKVQIH